MNFLHLTTFYPPYSFGGDAMYIYRLAHALGDAGHTVDVVHCIDSYRMQHPGEPEVKFDEHPHVNRVGLHSRYGWLSPLATHQTGKPILKMRRINELLQSKRYDVVHYHNISLLGPDILRLAQPGSKLVKLYTTHEHWLVCPNHVLWKFNQRACEKPECLPCVLMAKRPPQVWRYTGMLERASQHVDCFVSPSRFTARMHAERGFPQPVAHLPYFIDRADRDWEHPGSRPQEKPYFLFVGRLEQIKGLHTVLAAWKQVPEYDLLVVGAGNQSGELREMAADLPQVKFLGPKSQSELGALYFHAIATLVPSITYETFGIIIVESFARKTPVIVRDLGALPEVVNESQGGLVYQQDADLIENLHMLAKNPERRDQLGLNGYYAFLNNWCREAHLKMYFDLLSKIAKEKYGVVPWGEEMQFG
jgi:glycosyltransferase involved in cell wall biosynthesis